MRAEAFDEVVSVRAIAGTEVVLLGLDCAPGARDGLLGFRLCRTGDDGERVGLVGMRGVAGHDGLELDLLQGFHWGDYAVTPGASYRYHVQPFWGDPAAPTPGAEVTVEVTTEDPSVGAHGVFFNRGVAGSQAYIRQFAKYKRYYPEEGRDGRLWWTAYIHPQDIPDGAATRWLARGLEEGLLAFIGQATDASWSIRAALYELTHEPAIRAFVDALERGVDVEIVHHRRNKTHYGLDFDRAAESTTTFEDGRDPVVFKDRALAKSVGLDAVGQAAVDAVRAVGLGDPAFTDAWEAMLIPRTQATISHNKFIVLCKDGEPVQVWTGSTNLTPGGLYGQANVGHQVRDGAVARHYLDAWERLATDPKKTRDDAGEPQRDWTVRHQPDLPPGKPPVGMTVVFSPRRTEAMLDWYGQLFGEASSSIHFTTAFTVSAPVLEAVTRPAPGDDAFARYLLLEGNGGLLASKVPLLLAEPANRVAWGDTLAGASVDIDGEREEVLTGLNSHVSFLHTKYLLVDPLTDDPIVVSGSANFSSASTIDNDENMLIVRGDTALADTYLCEFMRLHRHFESRNRRNEQTAEEREAGARLAADGSWTAPWFDPDAAHCRDRRLFASTTCGW